MTSQLLYVLSEEAIMKSLLTLFLSLVWVTSWAQPPRVRTALSPSVHGKPTHQAPAIRVRPLASQFAAAGAARGSAGAESTAQPVLLIGTCFRVSLVSAPRRFVASS
jgi:hypothetical protein